MFVTTDLGEIPVSRVSNVRYTTNARVFLTLDDGSTVTSSRHWERALRTTPAHMLPATPGTYTLHGMVDAEGFAYSKTNVIGWVIAMDGVLYPLTVDGINDDVDESLAIEHPDGKVDVPGDRWFDSVGEWTAWAEERLRQAAATA